ncbi:unnamed protein product [Cochlearia groenlandica]
MMKLLTYLSLLLLLLLPLVSVVEATKLHDPKPIKDVSNSQVTAAAEYAAEMYNMVYERVVMGTEEVVAAKKFKFIMTAKNGGGLTKNYEAVVMESPGGRSRCIESFKAV